jgi:hypothetical protein
MALRIFDDDREIEAISSEYNCTITVGINDVTKIEFVQEPGEMSYIIWFAVYYNHKENPSIRINGKYVTEVYYKE